MQRAVDKQGAARRTKRLFQVAATLVLPLGAACAAYSGTTLAGVDGSGPGETAAGDAAADGGAPGPAADARLRPDGSPRREVVVPRDAGILGDDAPPTGHALKTVFIVMMENTSWSQVKGNPNMPYVNGLLPLYAHAEAYHTGEHPSLPNYVTLEAGANLGLTSGTYEPTTHYVTTTDHLTTYLARAGRDWKYYAENLPGGGTTCNLSDPGTPYSEDHNAFVYFKDVQSNTAYCVAHERPYSVLATDLAAGRAPAYSFIVPNDYDQGEKLAPGSSCRLCQADQFLSTQIPVIQASAQYKDGGVILILWDECSDTDTTGLSPSGLVVVSPLAKKGYSNGVVYTHASTVRTIEEIFDLSPLLGAAKTATDLSDFFTRFP